MDPGAKTKKVSKNLNKMIMAESLLDLHFKQRLEFSKHSSNQLYFAKFSRKHPTRHGQDWCTMTKNDPEWYRAVQDISFYETRSILKISFTYHLMNEFEIFLIWLNRP